MHDDHSAFDGEIGKTIEVMVVHDEDRDTTNAKRNLHTSQLLSYEDICYKINEEEKLRCNSLINFGYKGRLARDIVFIILIIFTYIITNPFTNIESSDPFWKMILSLIFSTICIIAFYFKIKVFKKDWKLYSMHRYKEWLEKNYR